jgi:hypothetical protein
MPWLLDRGGLAALRQAGSHLAARAIALALGAVAFTAGGCDKVVGLGPQAKLKATSSTRVGCGLIQHPNPDCEACHVESCCDLSLKCSASENCAEESQCAVNCVTDLDCIDECHKTFGVESFLSLRNCLIADCSAQCIPKGLCFSLGNCCMNIPAEDAIARDLCIGPALRNDEAGCQSAIESIARMYCPELLK